MRVLIVDDLAANRLLVRAMLSPMGHTLEEAAGGREAVAAARLQAFDLILMDLQMPIMDGLEAARTIRRDATANRETPIVALSADVLPDEIAACRAAGMDGHLAKPILPGDLIATVARWAPGTGEASKAQVPPTGPLRSGGRRGSSGP